MYEVYDHTSDTNLRYAMRGSGASFGIVTEFLYKVYPRPETLSCLTFTYLRSSKDFERLYKAGQDGRYAINILQPILLRRPKPANLVHTYNISIKIILNNVIIVCLLLVCMGND